ncbi:MAG: hypothetical protein KKF33_20355, partial [Alphaproteobacteria bacterium]|nr:hypothetical protein [Alphaproteobacteria bacterium]
ELAITTFTQRLSGGKPRALFNTPHDILIPKKSKLQEATNRLLDEIDFGDVLSESTQGAFFSLGIVKTGIDSNGEDYRNGYSYKMTRPFAASVTLDNWVHDMTATRKDKMTFCGDRLSLLLDDAADLYEHGDKLLPLKDTEGYGQSGERLKELTQGGSSNREYFRDICEVWEIWDSVEGRIITLAAGEGEPCDVTGEFIDVRDWTGPEKGPYHFLGFNPVRGNIMPLPPVSLWLDLHELANNVMRKLERQAQRQKTVFGVQPGGDSDGLVSMQANDGEMVKLLNPKSIANISFPGVEPSQLAFLIQLKNMASWLWGNIDALGGLSPQSETLGQDRLLTASASQRLVRMQNITIQFAQEVIHDLAELLYNEPSITLPLTKSYGDISIPRYWTPADRDVDFLHYNMTIDPYSLSYRTPSERLEIIRQTILQLAAPFAQQMQAQGIVVNYEKLFKIVGEYTGLDELKQILTYAKPQGTEEGPVRALQSPNTTRTNVRVNRPGSTSQGKDEAMIGELLGMGQQQSVTNQIGRATG